MQLLMLYDSRTKIKILRNHLGDYFQQYWGIVDKIVAMPIF